MNETTKKTVFVYVAAKSESIVSLRSFLSRLNLTQVRQKIGQFEW